MRIPTLTRYVALPASAALLALTGCASSGSPGTSAAATSTHASAQKLIEAAYTTTTAAKSARIAMTTHSDTPGEGDSGDLTITGVEDFEHQRTETTSTFRAMGTIEQRQIGSDMYIKLPSSLAKEQLNHDASKPWTHIQLEKSPLAAGAASLFGGVGADPASFVKLLTSVSSSVTAVGTDSVRGQQSTHYRMTPDEAKIRKLDAQMGVCGADDEPSSDDNASLDIWLDGQGRVTRIQVPMNDGASTPSAAPTSTSSLSPSVDAAGSGGMTVEFYDYGVPVSVEAPPADQTQTIPDAFGDSSDSTNSCTSGSSSGAAVPHS